MKTIPTKILAPAEMRELCIATMRAKLRAGAAQIDELFSEMSAWPQVPANLDINGEGWIDAEAAIDVAAQAGDLQAVSDLCADYEQRVEKFCNFYRTKYGKRPAQQRAQAGAVNS